MKIELCPYCGGGTFLAEGRWKGIRLGKVVCQVCGAGGPFGEKSADYIAKWNAVARSVKNANDGELTGADAFK